MGESRLRDHDEMIVSSKGLIQKGCCILRTSHLKLLEVFLTKVSPDQTELVGLKEVVPNDQYAGVNRENERIEFYDAADSTLTGTTCQLRKVPGRGGGAGSWNTLRFFSSLRGSVVI